MILISCYECVNKITVEYFRTCVCMCVCVDFQGTRKTLSPEILKAEDPDSPSADLVYSVLDQGEAKEKGYVERVQSPGVRVDTFTQMEVDQGLIAYVHRGGEPASNTRLALQVRNKVSSLADVCQCLTNRAEALDYWCSVPGVRRN